MDPTPELLAKLSRRLRKIEGSAAEVPAEASRCAREQAPAIPVYHSAGWSRGVSLCSDDSPGARRSLREGGPLVQRGRVRLPSWVHDGVEPPPSWCRQESSQLHGSSRHRGSNGGPTASVEPPRDLQGRAAGWLGGRGLQPGVPPVQDLLRSLQRATEERDAAWESIRQIEAGHASRGQELEAEAVRLRRMVGTLRDQLVATRGEILARRRGASAGSTSGQGPDAPAAAQGPASASGGTSRRAVKAETQRLVEELSGQAEQRKGVRARLGSLAAELEQQAACHRQLQGEVRSSRATVEQLKLRLEALSSHTAAATPTADGATGHPSRRRATAQASRPSALPPIGSQFVLDDDAPAQKPRASRPSALPPIGSQFVLDDDVAALQPRASRDASDLEFAYDWGLDLSSCMSVERALELTGWTAARPRSSSQGDLGGSPASSGLEAEAIAAAGGLSEAPLAEPVDALEVLQPSSAQCQAGCSVEGPRAPVEPATGSRESSDAGTGHFEQEQERGADGPPNWDLEIEKLQQAIKLCSGAQSADGEELGAARAGEPDDFAAPAAELQQVLNILHGVKPPAIAEDEAEAGISTPSTAPTRAVLAGNAADANANEANMPQANMPLATILTPFSALDPIQAIIRQKYARNELLGA